MDVLVSGSTGLIGRRLVPELRRDGHRVDPLVRSREAKGTYWNPATGSVDPVTVGADAVVHLAGENIASGRWTEPRKQALRASRVDATRRLAETLAAREVPPQVFVSASAIGFYGSRGDEILDEQSLPGQGFLAELCRHWEGAAEPLRQRGVRVVHLRFGVVLAPDGGALAQMLPVFRLGLGGRLGSGEQWMSWVAIDDVTDVVRHVLRDEGLAGPVNVVSPEPVRNAAFTRTLASVLGRPAVLPVPAFALRLTLGEMADEALLASQRVVPTALERREYPFRAPRLREALSGMLR